MFKFNNKDGRTTSFILLSNKAGKTLMSFLHFQNRLVNYHETVTNALQEKGCFLIFFVVIFAFWLFL